MNFEGQTILVTGASSGIGRTNMQRLLAQPEEMAGPILFLLSQEASYVTGQVLFLDGGFTRWK